MSNRNKMIMGRAAAAVAVLALGGVGVAAHAGVSGSVSLSNMQYLLSGPGELSLQLVPNTFYGPDGSQSLSASVTQSEPFVQQTSPLDRAATVPLMSGDDADLSVQLGEAQARATLQTLNGLTTVQLAGSQLGTGSYSAYASLDQGSWGLSFGPAGQGLLLSARTTLTITAQALAQVASGGDCAAGIGFDQQWCDFTGASVYLELAYNDPVSGERSYVWDQLKLLAQTSAPGVASAEQGERNMWLSFTNAGDTPMPIAFRYTLQVDGYGHGASVVPEPTTGSLMTLGALALAWRVRRRAAGQA